MRKGMVQIIVDAIESCCGEVDSSDMPQMAG